jgi:RimJ/RimL family protein N-acetyltransferase
VRLILERTPVRPVFARAAADNVASLRVLEKVGFAVIGTDRGYANARRTEIEERVLRLE